MAIYRKKLDAATAWCVMHISNRHLELASVVAGIARANGLVTRVNNGGDVAPERRIQDASALVAAVAQERRGFRRAGEIEVLAGGANPIRKQWVWTDDYSNIVGSVCACSSANSARAGQ